MTPLFFASCSSPFRHGNDYYRRLSIELVADAMIIISNALPIKGGQGLSRHENAIFSSRLDVDRPCLSGHGFLLKHAAEIRGRGQVRGGQRPVLKRTGREHGYGCGGT